MKKRQMMKTQPPRLDPDTVLVITETKSATLAMDLILEKYGTEWVETHSLWFDELFSAYATRALRNNNFPLTRQYYPVDDPCQPWHEGIIRPADKGSDDKFKILRPSYKDPEYYGLGGSMSPVPYPTSNSTYTMAPMT